MSMLRQSSVAGQSRVRFTLVQTGAEVERPAKTTKLAEACRFLKVSPAEHRTVDASTLRPVVGDDKLRACQHVLVVPVACIVPVTLGEAEAVECYAKASISQALGCVPELVLYDAESGAQVDVSGTIESACGGTPRALRLTATKPPTPQVAVSVNGGAETAVDATALFGDWCAFFGSGRPVAYVLPVDVSAPASVSLGALSRFCEGTVALQETATQDLVRVVVSCRPGVAVDLWARGESTIGAVRLVCAIVAPEIVNEEVFQATLNCDVGKEDAVVWGADETVETAKQMQDGAVVSSSLELAMPDKIADYVEIVAYKRKTRTLAIDARVGRAVVPTRSIEAGDGWYRLQATFGNGKHRPQRRLQLALRYIDAIPRPIRGTNFSVTTVYEPSDFAPADWGRVAYEHYAHHFIVLDAQTIVHFYGSYAEAAARVLRDGVKRTVMSALNGTFYAGRIHRGDLAEVFAGARASHARVEKVHVPAGACRPGGEVVRLAELLMAGDQQAVAELASARGVSAEIATTFNFVTSNCENLACYLKTGAWRSPQIEYVLQRVMTWLGVRLEIASAIAAPLVADVTAAMNRNPGGGVLRAIVRALVASSYRTKLLLQAQSAQAAAAALAAEAHQEARLSLAASAEAGDAGAGASSSAVAYYPKV
eukprot:m51a1_g9335 hypothetical protein (653) ;mRNA; r:32184-35863